VAWQRGTYLYVPSSCLPSPRPLIWWPQHWTNHCPLQVGCYGGISMCCGVTVMVHLWWVI